MMNKRARKKHNVVDSMKAAAARLGVDVGLLQFAKSKGCEAFKASRVNVDKLERWMAENKELIDARPTITRDELDLKLRGLKFERDSLARRREEFEFEKMREQYIRLDDVIADLGSIGRTISAAITSEFVSDAPPHLVGLCEADIRERLREGTVRALRHLHDRAAWYQSKKIECTPS